MDYSENETYGLKKPNLFIIDVDKKVAEKLNIRIGDRVLKANGLPVCGMERHEYENLVYEKEYAELILIHDPPLDKIKVI